MGHIYHSSSEPHGQITQGLAAQGVSAHLEPSHRPKAWLKNQAMVIWEMEEKYGQTWTVLQPGMMSQAEDALLEGSSKTTAQVSGERLSAVQAYPHTACRTRNKGLKENPAVLESSSCSYPRAQTFQIEAPPISQKLLQKLSLLPARCPSPTSSGSLLSKCSSLMNLATAKGRIARAVAFSNIGVFGTKTHWNIQH